MKMPDGDIALSQLVKGPSDQTISVGFWRWWDEHSELPWPGGLIDDAWNEEERTRVALYLMRKGTISEAYRGFTTCRLCHTVLGTCDMTDGMYTWPEGLEHYVDVHHVKLPEAFISHVNQLT